MGDGIFDNLLFEKRGNEPLYLQLRKKLKNYIASSPIGEKIPSERAIAQSAGVNRETVRNAIKDFIKKGVLKRGRRGTVITAKIEEVQEYQAFHPLLGGYFTELSSNPIKAVKFSLYETLPNQKTFWNNTINVFNASNDNIKVDIDWVDHKISSQREYVAYIKKEQSDIFLVNNMNFDLFIQNNILHEIPRIFRQGMNHDCFFKEFFTDNVRNKYSIPLHFSPRLILWNLELAKQLDIKLPENIKNVSRLPAFFNEISGKITKDNIATGNIWNFLVNLGFPENKAPDLEFFRKRFSALLPFINKYKNIFTVIQKNHFEAIAKFLRGEMLCYIGNLFSALQLVDRIQFPFRGEWTVPEEGFRDNECCSRIGVNKQSESIKEIFSFVSNFFAEDVSEQCIRNRINCSYRKSANNELEKLIPGLDIKTLNNILKHYISPEPGSPDIDSFLTFGIRSLYYKMMEGKIDISVAVEEAYNKFKQFENA